MDSSILVALIGIVGAMVTFCLTKRHELSKQWQKDKVNHYKVLFSAFSDLAVDGTDKDANMRRTLAVNTIALVAPQYVIDALMTYNDETTRDISSEEHDRLLRNLLLAVRKDIGLAKGDDITTFNFHLIGDMPPKD